MQAAFSKKKRVKKGKRIVIQGQIILSTFEMHHRVAGSERETVQVCRLKETKGKRSKRAPSPVSLSDEISDMSNNESQSDNESEMQDCIEVQYVACERGHARNQAATGRRKYAQCQPSLNEMTLYRVYQQIRLFATSHASNILLNHHLLQVPLELSQAWRRSTHPLILAPDCTTLPVESRHIDIVLQDSSMDD